MTQLNSYFRQLPDLDYPSLANDRQSSYDYLKVKNIFKRGVLNEDILNNYLNFEQYSIEGDERPDSVAEKFYKNPRYDWIILLSNNIISVRDEWPMSENDFYTYVNEKYTNEELSYIHHYETDELSDGQGRLIQPAGYWVDSDHSVSWLQDGVLKTRTSIKSVTYLQHEIALNDAKRNIDILKEGFVSDVMEDMKEIMVYKKSDQFITKTLKKTENPRIINPK